MPVTIFTFEILRYTLDSREVAVHMNTNANMLGDMIREAREQLHLTQEEVAEKLQVNLTHYGNIERGTNNPSLPLFIKIVKILNLSVDAYIYPEKLYSDDISQRIIRLLSQCTERERKIILGNILTLIENRNESPDTDDTEQF